MALDIYFSKDVADRLLALAQSNERTLQLAVDLGANSHLVALVREAYQGALWDVGVSFGLARTELVVILKGGSNDKETDGGARHDRVLPSTTGYR